MAARPAEGLGRGSARPGANARRRAAGSCAGAAEMAGTPVGAAQLAARAVDRPDVSAMAAALGVNRREGGMAGPVRRKWPYLLQAGALLLGVAAAAGPAAARRIDVGPQLP